jgi:hypothetical protein
LKGYSCELSKDYAWIMKVAYTYEKELALNYIGWKLV